MDGTNLKEETFEETPMTESEYLEAQKEAIKKNLRIWTGLLIYLLVVGLVLCILIYGVAMLVMFVINLLGFLKTKKLLERIENGEAGVKEVYEYYEALGRRTVKIFAVNIFLAGGLGVLGTINDMKLSADGMSVGAEILGEEYKDERIANDPNAKWKYCIYCKNNKTESFFKLHKLTDGVICNQCLSKYTAMLPKRAEDPALLPAHKTAHYISPDSTIRSLSSKDLEERLEYLKKNQEEYSFFTPTRVICDGCLELDEMNFLFRVASATEFNSTEVGNPSGLIHPYSAVKGIAYEMIYEYDSSGDHSEWRYTRNNSIVLAIDNPYLKEETFRLKGVPSAFFASSKKTQNDYSEQIVNELQEIFKKPVLEKRKLRL
ncbi:MAG: hypothetical protein K5879_09975 [Lachnospiraceae bacterium]|nr:hypothetical protein [Lachnospiraceae bacterium]